MPRPRRPESERLTVATRKKKSGGDLLLKIEESAHARTKANAEREARAIRAELADVKSVNKALHARVEEAEREINAYAHALTKKRAPAIIRPRLSSGRSESVALALASDWHVEEVVPAETVGGRNEYNPDIAKRRANRYFQSLLNMVRMARRDTKIETLVLWCGGDFVTGHIHEEMKETTDMAPLEAIDFAAGLLRSGLQLLLDHGDFREIVIPCSFGNHGRLTKKPYTTKAAEHNLEWFMYVQLQRAFESAKNVRFLVSRSRMSEEVEVFGRRLRFHHGEDLGFQGGLQGIYGRLFKVHNAWNSTRHCYLTCVGHWHQAKAFQDLGLINGSLIGYSAYSQKLAAQFEPPRQMYALIEKDHGMTFAAPIFVE